MNNKHYLFFTMALVFAGCAASQGAPDQPATSLSERKPPPNRPRRQYTIEEFMDTTRIAGASFSADENAILVSSDQTGIFNAFSISIRDAQRAPVSRSTNDSTFAVGYFPKDNRVL